MRWVCYFLGHKDIEFPTTNALLPVRKSLRPRTYSVLDGKGRGVDYKELVTKTVSSVLKIVADISPDQPVTIWKMVAVVLVRCRHQSRNRLQVMMATTYFSIVLFLWSLNETLVIKKRFCGRTKYPTLCNLWDLSIWYQGSWK